MQDKKNEACALCRGHKTISLPTVNVQCPRCMGCGQDLKGKQNADQA